MLKFITVLFFVIPMTGFAQGLEFPHSEDFSPVYLPDTIQAGDTLELNAYGDLPESGTFEWELSDPTGMNSDETLWASGRGECSFSPKKAYTTVLIRGRFFDSESGITIRDSLHITVVPGAPAQVVIEGASDSLASLREPAPLDTVRIGMNENENDDFFAVLRDKYGNWVSRGFPVSWSSEDTTAAQARSGQHIASGQGLAIRKNVTGRDTRIVVTSEQGFTDSVHLKVDQVYSDLRQVIRTENGFSAVGDTLYIRGLRYDTVWAQARRIDDESWETVSADWRCSDPDVFLTPFLDSSFSYRCIYIAEGHADLEAEFHDLNTRTVLKTPHFDYCPEHYRIRCYAVRDTAPEDQTVSHDTVWFDIDGIDTFKVDWGEQVRLFAELHGIDGKVSNRESSFVWELPDISFEIAVEDSALTFIGSGAVHVSYPSCFCYNISKTVYIMNNPIPPGYLVLEPNNRGEGLSPNDPQYFPDKTVFLSPEENYTRKAYTVLRDVFGNFMYFAEHIIWTDSDSAGLNVEKGSSPGEYVVQGAYFSGAKRLVAVDTLYDLCDTVTVKCLAPITHLKSAAESIVESSILLGGHSFILPKPGRRAVVRMFDLSGRSVAVLFDGIVPRGAKRLGMPPSAAGSYLIQIESDGTISRKRVMITGNR